MNKLLLSLLLIVSVNVGATTIENTNVTLQQTTPIENNTKVSFECPNVDKEGRCIASLNEVLSAHRSADLEAHPKLKNFIDSPIVKGLSLIISFLLSLLTFVLILSLFPESRLTGYVFSGLYNLNGKKESSNE